MDSISPAFLADLPRLSWLALAVSGGLLAAATYMRRSHHTSLAAMDRRAQSIVYREAPTVRVVDPQRVDRLRKVVRLTPGESVDVLETGPGLPPRFRIRLERIVPCEGGAAAQISVDFGGTALSCGPLVEETAFNQFVLPRASRDEPRNCVFHYQENGGSLDFMRLKLRYVDEAQQAADIDVLQVSGHWPAAA
ncbi:MAG: hypothetical protein DIU71_02105 [Proteobacteria bacterium]|nr:MAG: hypothetical protein DIU71_02105 [Pseudomonadota bacterium]